MKRVVNGWAWAVALWTASVASAAVLPREVGELTVQADRVVIGDVIDVASFWNAKQTLIMSQVDVAVSDYLKGEGEAVLSLEVPGGRIGDLTLVTSVDPAFEVGQHVVLFLDGPTNRLSGAFQGVYLSDGDMAVQAQPSAGCGEYLEPVPLAELLDEVSAALPGGQLPGPISTYKGDYQLPLGEKFTTWCGDWNHYASPMGENYLINANCADASCGTPATQRVAILTGADEWNFQGAHFDFSYGGATTSTSVSFNGQNIIYFRQTSGLDPSTIAVTYGWCSGGDFNEWDMEFNDFQFAFWDGVTGSCSGMMDIQSIATHELGHGLGLGHTSTFGATMYPSTSNCALGPRSLHTDDINGLYTIYPTDTTKPTPNPATWAVQPQAVSVSEVTMTATAATDSQSPPVQYQFDFVSGGSGGTDSSWLASNTYNDTGLAVNTQYTYRCRSEDSAYFPNVTDYSGNASVYTLAAVPGAPGLSNVTVDSMDLTITANGNPTATAFAVQCSNTTDGAWNGQWVDASGNPSATEVWQTKALWDGTTVTGLLSGTQYCFKSKARNGDGVATALGTQTCNTTLSQATIVSAASLLTHDVTERALDLTAVNIEPRIGGVQKIEFGVSETVSSVSAGVTCIDNVYAGTITTTPSGTTVTAEFSPALPDGDRCDITLSGDANDNFEVRTIRGDMNRSGTTDSVDVSQAKARFGQTADVAGPQWDYNLDDVVNSVDNSQVRLVFGNFAP